MKKINPDAGDFGFDLFKAIESVLCEYTTGDADVIEDIANEMADKAIAALVTEQESLSIQDGEEYV